LNKTIHTAKHFVNFLSEETSMEGMEDEKKAPGFQQDTILALTSA
jgi:hypothetical protein